MIRFAACEQICAAQGPVICSDTVPVTGGPLEEGRSGVFPRSYARGSQGKTGSALDTRNLLELNAKSVTLAYPSSKEPKELEALGKGGCQSANLI